MELRKGIILAGGMGTRLAPLTSILSKQLLPVYDKPMIYFPLTTLMLQGIREILIISTPKDLNAYRNFLGDGKKWGINLSYIVQPHPNGLAQAFLLGKDFIGKSHVTLILGDNIFYGNGLSSLLHSISSIHSDQATVFGYSVSNPEEYGVAEVGKNGAVLSLEEKPREPKSNIAVTGLYQYPPDVVDLAKTLKPSFRGELEITDLNKIYLKEKRLHLKMLHRGYAWLDTGTHKTLLEASSFIQIVQKRQNIQIGSPDEVAWRMGYIDDNSLQLLADEYQKTSYGGYLIALLNKKTSIRSVLEDDHTEIDTSSSFTSSL